jgi:Tol biopolymer transport system component
MKGRNLLRFLGLGIAVLVVGGCGEISHESSSYYFPNWMPDGRIIACKEFSQTTSSFWGPAPSELKYYITAITIDDNFNVIKEENMFESFGREITCSPTGELIGYVDGEIYITDYKGNNIRKITSTNDAVKYFDWSPDATKIAYSANNNLYIINIDGTNNNQIATSAEAVAWRVGEKIVFVRYMGTDYSRIATVNSDRTSEEVTPLIGGDPQKNETNIYYRGREDLNKELINAVRVTSLDGSGDALKISDYQRSTLKLSFDNTRIVGGDLITGGGSWIGDIWIIDINSGNSKRIK